MTSFTGAPGADPETRQHTRAPFSELWERTHAATAETAPSDQDWEWHEVASERLSIACRWIPFFLAGAVANSVLCIAVLSTTFPVETLALWALLHGASAAVVGLSLIQTKAPDRRTESGLPRSTLLGSVVIGALWGLPIWLQGPNRVDELTQWQGGAFLLLTTFLAIAFLEGARLIARNIMVPAWSLFALGLVIFGDVVLGVAAVVMLVVVFLSNHARGLASDRALESRTDLDRRTREAEWHADHDRLTGAFNRHGLRNHLDRPDLASSHFVLLVSLDNFSKVNDEFGLAVGDSVLREVAHRLANYVDGDTSCIARVSGDEFIVLVPGRDSEAALRLANEMIQRLQDPMYRGEDSLSIAATVGITQALGRPFDLGRALREANAALRKAVRSQRGTALLFTRSMETNLEKRLILESGLHRALVDDEIQVWGQPIVHLGRQEVSHVELVARWIRADGSRVPPSVFVPLAEEIGVMADLTNHMIRGAGSALHEFADHRWLRHAGVVVNTRTEEMHNPELMPALAAVVEEFEIKPGQLCIGLKDSALLAPQDAQALFEKLSALGVGLSMNDLHDGAPWLRDAVELNEGVLRLDKSLIKGARDSESQRDFVMAFTRMGTSLGFAVVAEGIEDIETARFVQNLGVRYAQGFLFARAMPLSRLVSEETASRLAETLQLLAFDEEVDSELALQAEPLSPSE